MLVGLACLLTLSGAAHARGGFERCGDGLVIPPRPAFDGDLTGKQIQITADDADLNETGVTLLRGDVQYNNGPLRMYGQRMRYDKPAETLRGRGDLQLWDDGVYLTGKVAELNTLSGAWDVRDGTYVFLDQHARGEASRFRVSAEDLIHIENGTYTTCNPGDNSWAFEAQHIELNGITDVGVARDAKLLVNGTPVFYTPWVTFPLSDERKSGLLVPAFGISSSTGAETTVPYYFNLAPHYDATVAARVMADRGVMGIGEFRYLSPYGRGEVDAEFLPHDTETSDARGAFSFRHDGRFAPNWRSDIDFNWVSDRDYLEDFGNTLSVTSTQYLPQSAEVRYYRSGWHMLGRVQAYQTVDRTIGENRRPYRRLPQLRLSYLPVRRNREFNYGGHAETVYFDNSSRVNGLRFHAEPYLSYPMRTPGTFVIPTVKLNYTSYHLDNAAPGADDSPDRLIPQASIDSGLLFERDVELFGEGFTQTLEPRAYYLYTMLDSQSDIPRFDTGQYTFSFAQLFRDNRFSGSDRIGDAHQVSLALTSRLLSASSGAELARASVGQIVHFRDRRVQLNANTPDETETTSDFVAEVSATLFSSLTLNAGTIWDPHENRTERATIGMRYQPSPDKVFNAGYRFVRDTAEVADVSFRWPLMPDVGLVGRWSFSLPEEQTLDAIAGVEYDTCCWTVRAVGRRFLSDTSGEVDTSVFLQAELKGLANFGRSTERFLERQIPGYQNPF